MRDRDFSREACMPLPSAPLEEGRAFNYGKNGGLKPVEVSERSRIIRERFRDIYRELRIARQFICLQ